MFIHPSSLAVLAESHTIITEEDFLCLRKSIDDGHFGDIEKARRDLSHLVRIQTPILRNGKIVLQTMYIDPRKTDKSKFAPKNYGGVDDKKITYKPEATKNIIVESNLLKRGDLVKIKLQDGTETVGQFRSYAIVGEGDNKKAIIRTQIKNRQGELVTKTVERNAKDIVLLNSNPESKEEITKLFDPSSFKVGDSVSITTRTKNPDSIGVKMIEQEGVLTKTTSYGFSVLLPDGSTVERPISTLRKVKDSENTLTKDQEILLNKAVKRIKSSIQDKVNLIDLLERKKPTNWEVTKDKYQAELESDKNLQSNYYQVFKGNLNFDQVITVNEEPIKRQEDLR